MRVSTSTPSVLIANLGAPAEPTKKAVRKFLRQVLSDQRVVETHPLLWKPVLEGVVLPTRPRSAVERYSTGWSPAGCPLLGSTRQQVAYLRERFAGKAEIRYAVRYGENSVPAALDRLAADGFRRLLVLPLYPQYSASTTATILDEVYRWSLDARDQFELRTVRSFPDFPGYISALVQAVEGYWNERGYPDFSRGDRLVLNYHSIAESMAAAGDPYPDECALTTALVAHMLGLRNGEVLQTFQQPSRKEKGLQPTTMDALCQLGESGVARVDVVCPGFVSDCAETLADVNIENREVFLASGGTEFHRIPWAGTSPVWLEALKRLVKDNLDGWL